MKLDTLAKAIFAAIVSSPAIAAHAVATFEKAHTGFYAADGAFAPLVDDCPAIGIYPASRSFGRGQQVETFTIRVLLGISQPAPVRVPADEDEALQTLTVLGPEINETFADLVFETVENLSGNISVDGAELVHGTIDEFPVFASELTLTINVPVVIGAEVEL